MKKTVSTLRVVGDDDATTVLPALSAELQLAFADVAELAREGLLAMSVAAGLRVMNEMMEAEVTDQVGVKHAKLPERTASRHTAAPGSVVLGGRGPSSTSARRTQVRNDSRCTPSFSAIDTIAFHCDGYSPWCSNTIRIARSRSSSGYLPPFPTPDMTPSSQGLEPPRIPGRFKQDLAPGGRQATSPAARID